MFKNGYFSKFSKISEGKFFIYQACQNEFDLQSAIENTSFDIFIFDENTFLVLYIVMLHWVCFCLNLLCFQGYEMKSSRITFSYCKLF